MTGMNGMGRLFPGGSARYCHVGKKQSAHNIHPSNRVVKGTIESVRRTTGSGQNAMSTTTTVGREIKARAREGFARKAAVRGQFAGTFRIDVFSLNSLSLA